MFVRKKPNKSGIISIQIIDKSSGKYKVIKTIGSSNDPEVISSLVLEGKNEINNLLSQAPIDFNVGLEEQLLDLFFSGIKELCLVGPELLLGKIFDSIGFNKIKDELFRHLVISRLTFPTSKLKTTDYLFKYKGERIGVDSLYRYLDKLHNKQKELVEQISYEHTQKLLGKISIVFYDVTTLYFEIEKEDDLRQTGFSKEGKHQNPQIVLGLLVSIDGYPLAYDIFEGKKFEGHTMLPVIEGFKKKYQLEELIVVADSGLLSTENVEQLQQKNYGYILGARLKNEKEIIKKRVLDLKLKNGQSTEIRKDESTKIIVSYSLARAKKDQFNRKRGLDKLEKNIKKGKLTKSNINNRGYDKYLKMVGDVDLSIDYEKFNNDGVWDGLKGYITNLNISKEEIILNYGHLWKIEKAFRISKTDLQIRPIYHRLARRIEAHICIAFCAYKIYKELERQLKEKGSNLSPEKAIDIAKTIYRITIITPYSKRKEARLYISNEEQAQLLKLFEI
ncbi:MAG TPA: IS1634 family transposase [Flavobacterium sp.]|nr:IS1634 family transposase [Flavobacterium sp.]